jgi:hypothetical protein
MPSRKFSDEMYQNIVKMENATKYIIYAALALFVLTLFYRKMIGLEMMILIQSSFISFSSCKYAHPYAGPLLTWKYVSGFNEWFFEKLTFSEVDSIYHYLGFEPAFWQNINIMLVALVIVYAVSIVLLIFSLCMGKGVRAAALKMFREVTFALNLFLVTHIVTSLCIEYESNQLM